MTAFENNAIFWIEVDKIFPNPYQPRREFNQAALDELSESIRMYGVLQPLTVTRRERIKDGGGLTVEYELIAGERRLRASKLAGLSQVPVLIKSGQQDAREKLELAIIENLQREDLNPIDRAHAFKQLYDEFGFKHTQIAKKVGKSREYVSNSIRLLQLPEAIIKEISSGRITEGHSRPLLMLRDQPQEQDTLLKEIIFKKLNVREAEQIAGRIAQDKVRKISKIIDPEILSLEKELSETLGTRVQIDSREVGGKLIIDFFTADDLKAILKKVEQRERESIPNVFNVNQQSVEQVANDTIPTIENQSPESNTYAAPWENVTEAALVPEDTTVVIEEVVVSKAPVLEVPVSEENVVPQVTQAVQEETSQQTQGSDQSQEDLYSIRNFSL